eukprot:TRINITY_DN20995_c0_g2_i1.p1 TRINITY_DN20995_c0_g2~~TRINITY_DN20995_c0_g2_i1.p1  ORF type:complete len:113 (+),score=18.86 TRINITY_DN20995_c0_g2_i1:95-433(+)
MQRGLVGSEMCIRDRNYIDMNQDENDEEEDSILKDSFLDFRFGNYKKEKSEQLYKNMYSLSKYQSQQSFRNKTALLRKIKNKTEVQPIKDTVPQRSFISYLIVSLNSPCTLR